ncbi:SurA N-terminal domain-containing protein [Bacillus shivajii]|uniref:SurA N-terminal domain-containing protein n=1 Tax=Bacillus shivajii TaxID=1983719 RepID=UPI001CFC1660|nr:SurA N-terminal domain-containing protein [Bacillus shivajii]UCZ54731.1 SurA N-terminal domain-containing protein [Bacillus shivajii]
MKHIKRNFLLAISLMTVLALAACGDGEDNGEASNGSADGEAAATVNGEDVPMSEIDHQLNQLQDLYAQQGLDFEDEENQELLNQMRHGILEELITQKILLQEAENHDIEASEEEVDLEFEQIKGSFSEEEFEQALEMQNYTEESLRAEIREMMKVQELLSLDHLDETEIEVSEDEMRDYYDQLAMQNEELGEFEEVQDQIETQLKQSKYLEKLRESAEIEIHI